MICTLKKILKYSVLVLFVILFIYQIFLLNNGKRLISYDNLSEIQIAKLLSNAKAENFKRISNVEKICRYYNIGKFKTKNKATVIYKEPPTPHYEIFYYDLKHKLSWCPVYKAGSSTWLYNFALLGGHTDEQINNSKLQLSHYVRNIFPPLTSWEAIRILPDTLKFVIIRHPFERILSAYRDKLENLTPDDKSESRFYYKKFGRKIVSKYRSGGNNTNTKFLLKPGQFKWDTNKSPIGIEPTFKEFVRYLIDTDLTTRADDHWIPFYLYCTPCTLTYDIIGKVETMLQDQLFIIHTAGLQNKIKPHWRHKTNPFNQTNSHRISEIAKIYFTQLNKSDVKELYEKYKLDFKLFQYDETEYYTYAVN